MNKDAGFECDRDAKQIAGQRFLNELQERRPDIYWKSGATVSSTAHYDFGISGWTENNKQRFLFNCELKERPNVIPEQTYPNEFCELEKGDIPHLFWVVYYSKVDKVYVWHWKDCKKVKTGKVTKNRHTVKPEDGKITVDQYALTFDDVWLKI